MAFESTLKKSFIMKEGFEDYLRQRRESSDSLVFNISLNHETAFFHYDREFIDLIASLTSKNAKLQSLYDSLPPFALKRMKTECLINDIQSTNSIEHIYSTKKEIHLLLEDIQKSKDERLSSIVNKYHLLMDDKTETHFKDPQAIRKAFDSLMAGAISKEDLPDGVLFRKGPVYISNGLKAVHEGSYPEEKIIQDLQQSLNLLNDASINPYIRLALFHYLFENIHPFSDGNGRTGRYLLSAFCKQEISPIFCFMISSAISDKKKEYYRAFQDTEDPRNHGDLTTFVYPFLELLSDYLDKVIQELQDRKQELEAFEVSLKENKVSYTQGEQLILTVMKSASLFGGLGLAAKDIQSMTGLSYKTVLRSLAFFEEKGLLHRESYGNHRIYSLSKSNG
jgi:Fic family protein